MEKLNERELEGIVGGLGNHISGMTREEALKILPTLSDGERKHIDGIRQAMTLQEFINFWENSNKAKLKPEFNNS